MRKIITTLIYLVVVPLIIVLSYFLYNLKQYHILSLILAVLALGLLFLNFEKKDLKLEKLVLIAAFVALATVSRILFNVITILPGFNPVSAIIILIAIVFGGEVGFMVGALTAFISNNYLSHGPWTVFQMFSWGIIGYLSGLFSKILKKNKIILIIFGIFSGILFSVIMDIYTVLSIDNAFNFKRFLFVQSISLPFTITHIVANVIFLILFGDLFIKRLERIIKKYNL